MKHMQRHKRHGELVHVTRMVNKQWRLMWEKPAQQKGSVASHA
jgi:hypothetical protein